MTEVIKVFNKSEYAGSPDERIKNMLDNLTGLGRAVIAGRGNGFSANIAGTIYLGEDGGDPVLRRKKPPLGECDCHVHIKWDRIHDFVLKNEDVGYGPEAVIYLLGEDGEPIVRIFYPDRTFAEVEAVLASDTPYGL